MKNLMDSTSLDRRAFLRAGIATSATFLFSHGRETTAGNGELASVNLNPLKDDTAELKVKAISKTVLKKAPVEAEKEIKDKMQQEVNDAFKAATTPAEKIKLLMTIAFRPDLPLPTTNHVTAALYSKNDGLLYAALHLLKNRPECKVSWANLKHVATHSGSGFRAAALRLLTERKDIELPRNFLRQIESAYDPFENQPLMVRNALLSLIEQRHPNGFPRFVSKHFLGNNPGDGSLRPALELIKARHWLIRKTSALDVIRCHEGLSEVELTGGDGVRLGQILIAKCLHGIPGRDRSTAEELGMPLLNLMRSVDNRFPGYLDCVGNRDVELRRFCTEALKFLIKTRREEQQISDRNKDVDRVIVGLLHDEEAFSPNNIKETMKELGEAGKTTVGEVYKYSVSAEERQMILWWTGAQHDPEAEREVIGDDALKKFEYLAMLEKLAGDRNRPAIIWNSGHGGPQHFWMTGGNFGDHDSSDLHHPGAISFREVGMCLIRSQTSEFGPAAGTKVDLSHLTIINDACMQFDFCTNVHNELFKLADILGIELVGLPRMVSASQRGMPDWFLNQDAEIDGRKFVQGSFLQNEIGRGPGDNENLSPLDKLLIADRNLRLDLEKRLSTVRHSWLVAEDVAIFSSRVWNLDNIVNDLVDSLNKKGMCLPPLPESKKKLPPAMKHVLQIALSQPDEREMKNVA